MTASIPVADLDDRSLARRGILPALLCAVLAYSLMQTLLVPALPQLAASLRLDAAGSGWILTSYLLSGAVAAPVLGALGDRHGHRRVLLVSLATFILGGILCALGGGFGVFLIGRVLQGAATAAFPLALAIVRHHLPVERQPAAIESFPLFGYDIADYEDIFEEKLDLFLRLMREDRVTWSGTYRSPLDAVRLHPRMPEGGIPAWIGIGGSPDSVVRAARHGLPLMMAIIGGRPERFAGHAELYLRALAQCGQPELPIAQHSLGFIADTDDEAKNVHWKRWQPVVKQVSEERGFYPPTAERYAEEVDTGALYVGSPETVARKIAGIVRANHLSRFDLKYDVLHLDRQARARSIRLFGEQVAPRVRELLADDADDWRLTGRTPAQIVKGGKAVHA